MKKKISILGSTGSIGTQTLDVVRAHPDKFEVVGLAEGHDTELLIKQALEFGPSFVSVRDSQSAEKARSALKCKVTFGIEGAVEVATMDDAQMVVSAIVGAIGILPTYRAVEKGKTIALANKETLVAAGAIMTDAVKKYKSALIPVDSEHSAIFQSLMGNSHGDVRRLILTASGGSFRDTPVERLSGVTVEDALKHPNWTMGSKITIDSATLMNKGLELIEAVWLFDMPMSKVEAVIHPQSIIHSMVEYSDGAVIAQLGVPDMTLPIAFALSYPERMPSNEKRLDLVAAGTLTFMEPDINKYPCLAIAKKAGSALGPWPCVMNAANEIAVAAFLGKRLSYLGITELIQEVMSSFIPQTPKNVDDVLALDKDVRRFATKTLEERFVK